jgi:hypothetical protein
MSASAHDVRSRFSEFWSLPATSALGASSLIAFQFRSARTGSAKIPAGGVAAVSNVKRVPWGEMNDQPIVMRVKSTAILHSYSGFR